MTNEDTFEDDNDFYNEAELGSSVDEDIELESKQGNDEKAEEDISEDMELDDDSVPEEEQAMSYSVDAGGISFEVEDDDDRTTEEEIFNPEERLRMFSDDVMSCCFGSGKEITQYALDKLLSCANPRLFRDENYVLFYILFSYRGKLK